MSVLSTNETLLPFLSSPLHFSRGLDPLGLQNTSEAAYSLLLPGLNNVTGRIRYYSFYCWLLHQYGVLVGSTRPLDQHKFIRRGELVLALVNGSADEPIGAIPGSLYAGNLLQDKGQVIFDLQQGTYKPDGNTEFTYWKNPNGAFGQYYTGSLRDIGLIIDREGSPGIFIRTPDNNESVSGELLAMAFDDCLSETGKKLMLDSIQSGFLNRGDLIQLLADFRMSPVMKGTDEMQLLVKMLQQPDFPWDEASTMFRKETLKLVMQHLADKKGTTGRSFTVSLYNEKAVGTFSSECHKGWYYYQLNEYWQYGCLAALNGLLTNLYDAVAEGWVSLDRLIKKSIAEVLITLKEDYGLLPVNTIEDVLSRCTTITEEQSFVEINETSGSQRTANAVLLIFRLRHANEAYLLELKDYASKRQVERDGDIVTFLLGFARFNSMSLQDFLYQFLYEYVINRHRLVAFRKMSLAQSTQLFLLEENQIRFINNFEPGSTGPRLDSLIGFLRDLDLFHEGELTVTGHALLAELNNSHYE